MAAFASSQTSQIISTRLVFGLKRGVNSKFFGIPHDSPLHCISLENGRAVHEIFLFHNGENIFLNNAFFLYFFKFSTTGLGFQGADNIPFTVEINEMLKKAQCGHSKLSVPRGNLCGKIGHSQMGVPKGNLRFHSVVDFAEHSKTLEKGMWCHNFTSGGWQCNTSTWVKKRIQNPNPVQTNIALHMLKVTRKTMVPFNLFPIFDNFNFDPTQVSKSLRCYFFGNLIFAKTQVQEAQNLMKYSVMMDPMKTSLIALKGTSHFHISDAPNPIFFHNGVVEKVGNNNTPSKVVEGRSFCQAPPPRNTPLPRTPPMPRKPLSFFPLENIGLGSQCPMQLSKHARFASTAFGPQECAHKNVRNHGDQKSMAKFARFVNAFSSFSIFYGIFRIVFPIFSLPWDFRPNILITFWAIATSIYFFATCCMRIF